MHHSLHRVGQFHIDSPGGDAGNDPLKSLSQVVFHIFHLLEFICLPLCLVRPPLRLGRMLCHLRQNAPIMGRPLLPQSSPKPVLDNPVNLQVGVPADRRGKMTVILAGQPKMPAALHAVLCLFHAPQGHTADHGLLGSPRDAGQKFLNLLGMNLLPGSLLPLPSHGFHIIAEIVDDGRKFPDPLPVRHIVDTVHKGQFQPVKMLRNGLVCRQHKIFYNIRCHIPLIGQNLQRMPRPVQPYLTLRKIKVNRSPPTPSGPKNPRQFLHILKHGKQFSILFIFLLLCQASVLQKLPHHIVGHAAVHADD